MEKLNKFLSQAFTHKTAVQVRVKPTSAQIWEISHNKII